MSVSRETLSNVSRETASKLEVFSKLLLSWNSRINLVAPADAFTIKQRHIDDSLRLVPFIAPGIVNAIDLGSGAGFPGLVVAIATGIHVHLIEADRRKSVFLLEAARLTDASVTVHTARVEDCPCEPAPLVMSRALAPLTHLLDLASPLLAQGGIALFHKGRRVAAELEEARKRWVFDAEPIHDEQNPDSVILRLSGVSRV